LLDILFCGLFFIYVNQQLYFGVGFIITAENFLKRTFFKKICSNFFKLKKRNSLL